MRVLTVGLKSQNEMAKVNSAVGILSHLGTTHKSEIKMCVQKLLQESEDPFVIPFFINLSSLSELMATIGKRHAFKKYDQFTLNTVWSVEFTNFFVESK